MNKSLTPSRKLIFNALRSMKRADLSQLKGCLTYDGRVYAYAKPISSSFTNCRDQRHIICTKDDLEELCREYMRLQLAKFIESFRN